ncbi:GGDEF domain-containing protein [Vibrio scophthalmi]|uniref:GGDEF domain-containing protein n=1 Tax=Vibrio scophthalmi TaxID=45658 RepID=UPI003EBABE85
MKKLDIIIVIVVSLLLTLVIVRSKYEDVNNELIQNFRYLSDSIYRYQINSMNATLPEPTEHHDVIFFDVYRKDEVISNVIDVEKELNYLRRTLGNNLVVMDSLWTVANIFPNYMFVKPFRGEYISHVNDAAVHHGDGYFNYLLNSDGVESELNFDTTIYETISVFGPYNEITGESIFTFTFPLYLDRQVKSIIVVDVKADFLENFLSRYNIRNFSYFKLSDRDIGAFIFNTIAMQNINSGYESIIKVSFLYVVLLFLFFFVMFTCANTVVKHVGDYVKYNSIDQLTGLHKRDRYKLSEASRRVNCMAIIDIDLFKNINDSFGHAKGDHVITEVCNRITNAIDPSDVAIRWGGEEFVIIFDDIIELYEFTKVLDNLLYVINSTSIHDLPVTVSIGGVLSKELLIFKDAFLYADKALYESKRTGRNKQTIVVY